MIGVNRLVVYIEICVRFPENELVEFNAPLSQLRECRIAPINPGLTAPRSEQNYPVPLVKQRVHSGDTISERFGDSIVRLLLRAESTVDVKTISRHVCVS